MCGIVGYTGSREATPIILEGLRKLEYRGYDSAGICTIEAGKSEIRRSEGKLVNLEQLICCPAARRDASASATPAGPPMAGLPRSMPIRTRPGP